MPETFGALTVDPKKLSYLEVQNSKTGQLGTCVGRCRYCCRYIFVGTFWRLWYSHLDVSLNGGTQQPWGFPTKNDNFGVFWGYHHFRKPPFQPQGTSCDV